MPDSNTPAASEKEPPQSKWKIFLSLIPIVLIIGFVTYGVFQSQNSATNAKAGDCLTLNASNKAEPFTKADCNRKDVLYKIYAIKATGAECIEVPGTSRTLGLPAEKRDGKFVTDDLCIGEKNADLSKAINDTDISDCLMVVGQTAEKISCQANMSRPVLGVLKDVLKGSEDYDGVFSNECLEEGAEDTQMTYNWGLENQNSAIKTLTWDRVICLGEELAL